MHITKNLSEKGLHFLVKSGIILTMANQPRKIRYRYDLLKRANAEQKPHVGNLCNGIKISRQTYYAALRGDPHISLDMIEKIAVALGYRLADVFLLVPIDAPAKRTKILPENERNNYTDPLTHVR